MILYSRTGQNGFHLFLTFLLVGTPGLWLPAAASCPKRHSHPADHGPSLASLYFPFCRYATSSPDRGKSLLAGSGQLRCDSRTGQIKNALARTATPVDVPTGWDPNTKKEPTGLFFAACGRPCSFDSSYGLHEKIPDPKIRDFIHDPYGNRTHVTAVKGPCLNRLTNGPYKYRASLKPPTFIIHYCGRPSPLS